MRELIEAQTDLWASESRDRLAAVDKRVSEELGEHRPGGIQRTLEALPPDAHEVRVRPVFPGMHEIEALCTHGGEPIVASSLVNVAAGELVKVSLRLAPVG